MQFGKLMQVEELFLLHWQKLPSLLGWRRIGEIFLIKFNKVSICGLLGDNT
jgi:hypothetical protein